MALVVVEVGVGVGPVVVYWKLTLAAQSATCKWRLFECHRQRSALILNLGPKPGAGAWPQLGLGRHLVAGPESEPARTSAGRPPDRLVT